MTDHPRANRSGDRLFQRLYREITKFRYTEDAQTFVVSASTEVCFHQGSAIVKCEALEWIDGNPNPSAVFDGPDIRPEGDPTGETIRQNMVHSSAIRLGVAAHDHLLERVRAVIPETAERVP